MPRVELAPEVADDFERILEHIEQHEVSDAAARVGDIIQAINALETNPRREYECELIRNDQQCQYLCGLLLEGYTSAPSRQADARNFARLRERIQHCAGQEG